MKTVLIIAHECAPYNRPQSMIGAQRPALFARHLPAAGWRAIVLCRDAHHEGAWTSINGSAVSKLVASGLCEVEARGHAIVPIPSLCSAGALDRRWRSAMAAPKASRSAARWRRLLTGLKLLTGDHSENWHACALQAAQLIARRVPLDCLVAEHSPAAGLFVARRLHREFGTPWVVDFRDPLLLSYAPTAWPVCRAVVRHQLRSTHATVNVNPWWTAMDQQDFHRPAVCIPNGFEPTDFPIAPPPTGDTLTLGYAGHVNAGQEDPYRGVRILLEGIAIAAQRTGSERIRLQYMGGSHDTVRKLADEAKIGPTVACVPRGPRNRALRLLADSDVLPIFTPPDVSRENVYYSKGFYPGKVFECMGARRPIIAIPGDGAQLDELITRTGTGVALRTPEAVATHLQEALTRKRAGIPLHYCPMEQEIAAYSRASLAAKLAQLLDRAIPEGANA